jgi:hypothetical protein
MERTDEAPGGGVICAKCGISFETPEELDRHIRAEHGQGDEEQTVGE